MDKNFFPSTNEWRVLFSPSFTKIVKERKRGVFIKKRVVTPHRMRVLRPQQMLRAGQVRTGEKIVAYFPANMPYPDVMAKAKVVFDVVQQEKVK